jgi:hypothetical protein
MSGWMTGPICVQAIDIVRALSLRSLMRWLFLLSLLGMLPASAATNTTAPAATSPNLTKRTAPTAEPENAQGYAPPQKREEEGPTEADLGPFQRHFVLASKTDDLASLDNPPTVNNLPPEKVAIDKRISVPKIHDVQDDSSYKGGQNHALLYEVDYINWGAVTQEQLHARQGHYFTITWVNDGPKDDFVVRFQYREVGSKEIVRTLTQPMPHVSGAVRSYFAVVNKAYLAYGPVSSWRFTILKGDTVVAETKSFIW